MATPNLPLTGAARGKNVVNLATDPRTLGTFIDKGVGDIPLQEGVSFKDIAPRKVISGSTVERIRPDKPTVPKLRDNVPRLATMASSAAGKITGGMKLRMGLNKLGIS